MEKISIKEELDLAKRNQGNFVVRADIGKAKGLCVGISHTRNRNHPQFKELFDLIAEFNPDCLILELPLEGINALKEYSGDELIKRFGERGIVYERIGSDVNVVAGDVDYGEFEDYVSSNFSEDENSAHILLRRVLNYKNKPEEKISNIIKLISKDYDLEVNESVLRIIEEYLMLEYGRGSEDIFIREFSSISPLIESNPISQIEREISFIRDDFMFKQFSKSMNGCKRVLLLAGRNHILRLNKRIENLGAL